MTEYNKVGIVIYMSVILVNAIFVSLIYQRAAKGHQLYRLMACYVVSILWMFFGIIEFLAKGTPFQNFSTSISLIPVSTISIFVFRFVVHYVGLVKEKYATFTLLFFLPAILLLLPLFIPSMSHLAIIQLATETTHNLFGPAITIVSYLSYLFLVASAGLIIWHTPRDKKLLFQRLLLVLAVTMPAIISFLQTNNIIQFHGFNLSVLTMTLFFIVMTNLVFRYNFIDVVPKAAYSLYSKLRDAILILNLNGDILEYNGAVEAHFHGLVNMKNCKNTHAFLDQLVPYIQEEKPFAGIGMKTPGVSELSKGGAVQAAKAVSDSSGIQAHTRAEAAYPTAEEKTVSIVLINGSEKQFHFSFLPILDEHKMQIGSLLQCRDVTLYRMQMLEKERLRLSNDLHDSVGNSLNIIGSNLEYVLDHYENYEANKEFVQKSYERTTNAVMDMRRIVNQLNPVDIENNGLIWALESLFGRLNRIGLEIDFYCSDPEAAVLKDIKMAEAIYYICQESLNNAIVHGHAHHISLVVHTGSDVKLYITDDGCGCETIIENNGLKSIRNRTESLGGQFEYGSPSDGGFHIRILWKDRTVQTLN